MNPFSSWIQQHILRGGWDVDLTQAPPSREALEIYARRAWRRKRLLLAGMGMMTGGVLAAFVYNLYLFLQGLIDGPVLIHWSLNLFAGGLALVFTGYMVLGAIIGFSTFFDFLTKDQSFEVVAPAWRERLEAWREAVAALPTVARYAQELSARRPVCAEVAAAREQVEQLKQRDLPANANTENSK